MMETTKAGAESVYRFIERTAERGAEGVRWRTIDYGNEPQYHFNVFNGCGGISFFLAEYYGLTGKGEALELAIGGNRWCSAKEQQGHSRGLHTGKTGVAMAWLHLARIARELSYRSYALENAEIVLAEDPGPVTDLMGGAASNGLFLIRLWEATGEARYLRGAVRNGDWLAEHLTRDARGCHCIVSLGGEFGDAIFTGVAHGIAGVAHFFLLLHGATREAAWAGLAREILDTLVRHAIPDRGGLNWSPVLGDSDLSRCQWSHGSPGIGLVFAKAAELLEDRAYREVALQCGTTTQAYGDFRNNATQCIGLAGCGELFIELFRLTKDQRWLAQAQAFADLAYGYRVALPEGDA